MSTPPPINPPPFKLPPQLRKPSPTKSNRLLLFGLIGFGLLGFSFPFYFVHKSNLDASKPLGSAAIRRGPYANSGSRDAGPIEVRRGQARGSLAATREIQHNIMVVMDQVGQFFSLEVFVHSLILQIPCDIPAISFRLLDYPLVVIYHENIHKYVFDDVEIQQKLNINRNFTFDKGFLLPLLEKSPLALNVLDVYIPSSVKLLSALSINVHPAFFEACEVENNSDGAVVHDSYQLKDLVDNNVGEIEVTCRVCRVGPPFHPHVESLTSPLQPRSPPVSSRTKHAPPRPEHASPRTSAHASSPQKVHQPKKEEKREEQEEKSGEYCPPAMFYSSSSPQRKVPVRDTHDSPTSGVAYFSPNIYIEPPNTNSDQMADAVSPRRRSGKPPRDATLDTHAVLETVAAEFLRYLRLRRGHIPALQLPPSPSPPLTPPPTPPPASPPSPHPHPPSRMPASPRPQSPSHYSGSAHAKCKIPPKHELFKASPPPSKRNPTRKGVTKETGLATQTSFKDIPSHPFASYLPPPHGHDSDSIEIKQHTSPTFHYLTQPPKPQPPTPPKANLQLVSLQTDVSLHPDINLQVRASLQSIAGLLATSSHEPQELDDQMRQLKALQLQLRELQLRALQKPDQNRQQSPQPSSPELQADQNRQSPLPLQPQPSQSPLPPKYPAVKSQAKPQPKLVPAEGQTTNAPKISPTKTQTTSTPKIARMEESEYRSRWKKMREAGSFLEVESDGKESEINTEDEKRSKGSTTVGKEEEGEDREEEAKDREEEAGEKDELYSDYFESSDEHDSSMEARRPEQINKRGGWSSESDHEDEVDKKEKSREYKEHQASDKEDKKEGRKSKWSSGEYKEGLKSGSLASSGEIDEIIQQAKTKQMSDEIEEEIDEAEPDDEVDEDIHSGSAYDEDFVSDE